MLMVPRPAAARRARLVVLAIALPFLLLIGAFVVMPFIASDEVPLNAVGPVLPAEDAIHGGLVLQGTANVWEVRGQLTEHLDHVLRFQFTLTGPTGQPAPAELPLGLVARRKNDEASAVPWSVTRVGAGAYIAEARLPAGGRWQLRLKFSNVTAVFEYDSQG